MDTRPRTPLISFCTVQLRTLCAAHFLATLCLCTTSGPDLGELPGFWGSMVFRLAPIPRKGSGNQKQQHLTFLSDLAKYLFLHKLKLAHYYLQKTALSGMQRSGDARGQLLELYAPFQPVKYSRTGASNSRPLEPFNAARESILKFLMHFSSCHRTRFLIKNA